MAPRFLSRHWAGGRATYNTRRRVQGEWEKGDEGSFEHVEGERSVAI